ncbi:MAG: Fic family protein, partial [Bacilli bacterium]|nr:Fic family protein [Bacilli bacterium]
MPKDNAIEFTELKYTSRKEMGNELGIVVPDDMWKKVVNYRSTFNNVLSLKDIGGRNLNLCLYPTLASKCLQVESKLVKLLNDFNKLSEVNGNKQHFTLTLESNALESLSKYLNIEIDGQRLRRVITSENPFDENEERLLNYYSALQFIQERYVNKIDVDFLAELYSRVTGISELTYFYRDSDINDLGSIALVGRSYSKAPCRLVEPMMESLFSFIESSTLSPLNKALITYYYVLYVYPFNDFNQEIAFLLAKSVFAHFSMWEFGVLLPIEPFALEKESSLNRIFSDVRNSADVTYLVSPFVSLFDHNLDDVYDVMKEYLASEIRNDFFKTDEPVKEEKPAPVPEVKKVEEKPKPTPVEEKKVETVSLFDEPEEEKEEEMEPIPVVEEEPQVEPEPVKEEKTVEEEKKKEVSTVVEKKVQEVSVIKELPEPEPEKAELAVSYIPKELDEKDARRLEQHLLELDVRLKKGEAYFYARHCTIGMYYTIEQYKKALK